MPGAVTEIVRMRTLHAGLEGTLRPWAAMREELRTHEVQSEQRDGPGRTHEDASERLSSFARELKVVVVAGALAYGATEVALSNAEWNRYLGMVSGC
jgi:hypothetical protein